MSSFRLITFGCKVNQCDSAGMARELALLGWCNAAPGETPDLVVVNTCTVTARADQQARQSLRRLAREHPGTPLWVTGCYAQRAPAEVAALPGVQTVFGNQEKGRLAHLLIECGLGPAIDAAPVILSPPGAADALSLPVRPDSPSSWPDSPSPLMGEGWGGGEKRRGGAIMQSPPPSPLHPGEGEEGISEKRPLNTEEPFTGPRRLVGTFSPPPPFRPWPVHPVPGHTRAWLKVQEGCSHHCRYCIVPQVRGPRRSLDPAAVLRAFEDLAGLGYQEVVLTGVDLGQYGLDHAPPSSLAALVRRLRKHIPVAKSLFRFDTFSKKQIPPNPPFSKGGAYGISFESPPLTKGDLGGFEEQQFEGNFGKRYTWPFRVRLSSLEPQMVTTALLDELAAWPEFCPHFHLPLQSGAAPVLAAMGRPYGPEEFRDLVREIIRRFPGAGLGLDVLVGFPGETEADFEATRSLVAALPVTYLHVFPYSPRPGTPAADLPPLPGNVIQARARIMRELGQAKKTQFLEAQLGQTREVLVEGPAAKEGWLQGLSDHYLRVTFPGPPALRNRRVMVRFTLRQGEVLVGESVPGP
jgi:threonylcarbamoyladenosine tRNA methylthiotransferase MtaB